MAPDRALRRLRSEEAGFTLVEFLVVMSMMLVMVGAIVPSLLATTNQGDRQADRITSLDHDRVALDRMTHELRQESCASATSQVLTISEPNASSGCSGGTASVSYDCSVSSQISGKKDCVRTDLVTSSSTMLIEGVDNVGVFAVTQPAGGRPAIQIHLQKTPDGASRPVILRGGATLRVAG